MHSPHGHAFFLLLARLSGFFLLSPLFSGKAFSIMVRIGAVFATSLLLAPPLLANFQGNLDPEILFVYEILKEILIGYLIGFLFSLLFEAASFAGQLVGTLMGFSATELLDPVANVSHPMMARFFSFFSLTLFFTLDLHHPLLKLIFESFEAFPLKSPMVSKGTFLGILQATALLFQKALEFSLFPLFILLAVISIFALLSRFLPIFWIGFPLQLLVGYTALGLSLGWFAPLLEKSFFQCLDLVKKFIVHY